jgi:hypothetical protein
MSWIGIDIFRSDVSQSPDAYAILIRIIRARAVNNLAWRAGARRRTRSIPAAAFRVIIVSILV